jgi:hypothetical protein
MIIILIDLKIAEAARILRMVQGDGSPAPLLSYNFKGILYTKINVLKY